jgi:hypothetical protein
MQNETNVCVLGSGLVLVLGRRAQLLSQPALLCGVGAFSAALKVRPVKAMYGHNC